MEQTELIPGESILQYSDNGLITLTTHRIRYNNKTWGQSNFISIMLEKISSVQVIYLSFPVLLILGAAVLLIGFGMIFGHNQVPPEAGIPVGIGIIFIIFYFASRRHVCIISSDGGAKIMFRTDGMNTNSLISMMDKIELAKSDRLLRN